MHGYQIGEEIAKILREREQFVLVWFLDGLDMNHQDLCGIGQTFCPSGLRALSQN